MTVLKLHQSESTANESAVELLEKMLDDARAGRITSVAIAAVTPQTILTEWSDGKYFEILAAVTRLQTKLALCDETDEEFAA